MLARHGVRARVVRKQSQGPGPDGEPTIVTRILEGQVDLIVNTPFGVGPRRDGYEIRTAAVDRGLPAITTVAGLAAAVEGIESLIQTEPGVRSLQSYRQAVRPGSPAPDVARPGSPSERGTR